MCVSREKNVKEKKNEEQIDKITALRTDVHATP